MFMFAVVLMGVPVLMLMVVRMLAFVLMTTMVCMGLLVFVLVLVVMHCFMKLVVDHLERYRIDNCKNACGHCSVKSSRLNCGCGNAIAKQCHGFVERCSSSSV
ncbi:MAG: hypothetical protein WCN85_03960 [Burkholderiales bacterium]